MDKKFEGILLKSTSIIHAEDVEGECEQATCFFVKKKENVGEKHYLITNKHVLKDKEKIHLYLDVYHKNSDTYSYNKKVTVSLNHAVKFHDEYDLAALNIGCIAHSSSVNDVYYYEALNLEMIPKQYDMFSNFQQILMLGYPSGIHDTASNLPVSRSGITATPVGNHYKNRKEFLINIPFLNGSSGSPIFAEVDNQVYLIGIEYSKFLEKVIMDRKKSRLYHSDRYTVESETGLGIAIRSDLIFEVLGKN